MTRVDSSWPGDWARASQKWQACHLTGCIDSPFSLMCVGNRGCPVSSEPKEGLLWHKSQKFLKTITEGLCHNAVQKTLLLLGLCSCRLVRVPIRSVRTGHWSKARRQACGGSVMQWTMCPDIHVDIILICATYLNIVVDQVPAFSGVPR